MAYVCILDNEVGDDGDALVTRHISISTWFATCAERSLHRDSHVLKHHQDGFQSTTCAERPLRLLFSTITSGWDNVSLADVIHEVTNHSIFSLPTA